MDTLPPVARTVPQAATGRVRLGEERPMKAVIPLILLGACAGPELSDGDLCEACEQICTYESVPGAASAQHITGGVVYADSPPAGGDHDPCWAPFGAHEVALDDFNWVHNLEHGAVVYLHNCLPGCADEVAELEALAGSFTQGTWIVTPYPALETRFAAVSWGWRMQSDCFDAGALDDFYALHVGNAPENVLSEPSESCM
jgi:hypothetical protein